MKSARFIFIIIAGLFISCGTHKKLNQSAPSGIYSDQQIMLMMEKVYDWQIANPVTINEKMITTGQGVRFIQA